MATRRRRRSSYVGIATRRWAGYALAAAATSMAGDEKCNAEIIYSGIVNLPVDGPPLELVNGMPIASAYVFQISTHGNGNRSFIRSTYLAPYFSRLYSHYVGGFAGPLPYGLPLTSGLGAHSSRVLLGGHRSGSFETFFPHGYISWSYDHGLEGTALFALRFDVRQGTQYAWFRVSGVPGNYTVVDWAYGTPGQPLSVGQTSVPESGSLGLLAVGAVGLLAWRAAQRKNLSDVHLTATT